MHRRSPPSTFCPELAAYWQTFALPGGEMTPLIQTPCEYTDVLLAFVAPDEEGVLHFAGPFAPSREEVRFLQRRGQRVLLSIGGGGVTVALGSRSEALRFAESLREMIAALEVDGVDIDVEQGMPALGTPDRPEGPVVWLMEALDRVLCALPPNFLLTLAPETASLVGGITRYGGAWGNYLPLLLHYGDRISRVHMQYYNSGPMIGLGGNVYEPGTVPFAVAMTEAVIQGFMIADTGVFYPGLPPWKVSIGLPAAPWAASNGYLSSEQICDALYQLRTGDRGADTPAAKPIPNIGGLMTWSVQWDAQYDHAFLCGGLYALGCCC